MYTGFINWNPFTKKYDIHIEFMKVEFESVNSLSNIQMKEYVNARPHVNWFYPSEIGNMI